MPLLKTHFAEPLPEAGSDDVSSDAVERAWADRIRLGIGRKTGETQLARGLKFLRDRIRQAP